MRTVFFAAAALALCGCGGDKSLPMAATPESARETLVAGLDGWKAGKSFQEMLDGNPSVQFVDDDIHRRTKLTDYKIEGEAVARGTGYSFVVLLKLQDKDGGRARDKKVSYSVVSEPKRAITREDRQP